MDSETFMADINITEVERLKLIQRVDGGTGLCYFKNILCAWILKCAKRKKHLRVKVTKLFWEAKVALSEFMCIKCI